jgi:hypothetical protein
MVTRIAGFILLFVTLPAVVTFAQPTTPCEIVVPILDAQQKVLTATAPDGHSYPVFRAAPVTELTESLRRELETSFAQEALRLDRFARNLSASKMEVPDQSLTSPMYLLMSTQDGGFARFGFWLEDTSGKRRFVPAGYVDLVIGKDAHALESGNFEEIFPHELGHLVLRTLTGGLPAGPSRKMHQSMTVTDYPTAFDEGFAEHFQPIVRDATTNSHLRRMASGTGSTDFELLWLSDRDTQLRTDGVKHNLFIHRKPLPENALDVNPDLYRVFVDAETSTVFLPTELKTGQQMMASEGVIATLFYRIVNDNRLRTHYREAQFYIRFLGGDPAASPEKAITPYENVNLKLFAALAELRGDKSGRPPMISLVEHYAKLFPDEAKRIQTIFVETTWGATVSQKLASELSRAALDGGRGDMSLFTQEAPFRLLYSTVTEVAEGKRALDANVGPELWISNSDFKIARAMWTTQRSLPLTINLNTATEPELMTISGMNLELAKRTLAARRERGFFQNINDLGIFLPPEIMRRLKAMSENMKQIQPYQRD